MAHFQVEYCIGYILQRVSLSLCTERSDDETYTVRRGARESSEEHIAFIPHHSFDVVLHCTIMSNPSIADILENDCVLAQWASEIDIQHLDAKIARLRNALVVLQRQRNSLQPVYRLPEDVLRHIFDLAASERSEQDDSVASPRVLTHVCYAWRVTALSDGRLWWDVDLALPRLEVMARVELSKPFTFEVSFCCSTLRNRQGKLGIYELSRTIMGVMQHANRITNVRLDFGLELDVFEGQIWPAMLRASPVFSRLRTFEVQGKLHYDRDGRERDFSFGQLLSQGARNLTSLHLMLCTVTPSQLKDLHLRSLRIPDCGYTWTDEDWRTLLHALSHTLEDLAFPARLIDSSDSDASTDDDSIMVQNPLTFVSLTSLKLLGYMDHVQPVLSELVLPVMKHLELEIWNDSDSHAMFFANVINRMMTSAATSYQLAFSDQCKVQLIAHDGTGSFILTYEDIQIEQLDILDFSNALNEEWRLKVTELAFQRWNSRLKDEGEKWDPGMMPYAGLSACFPHVEVLVIDHDLAKPILRQWRRRQNSILFPGIRELNITKGAALDKSSGHFQKFLNAISTRNAISRTDAIVQAINHVHVRSSPASQKKIQFWIGVSNNTPALDQPRLQ
jgi:hypothetical protein